MRGRGGDCDTDLYLDPSRELEQRSNSAPPDQHLLYYPLSDKILNRHHHGDTSSSTATTPLGDPNTMRMTHSNQQQQQQQRSWDNNNNNNYTASPLFDSARQAWSSTPNQMTPSETSKAFESK